ncbi:Y-family DNA polymerase [Deinococcus sonorensis]|uniref:Y-family DNA polymerase n=2 Tax=Deinococcus sonorensis TaxID=309891 RepID=A0AAU7UFS4_9DEIO
MPGPLIACVHLASWALSVVSREHPGLPVAVLSETTHRVLQVNHLALGAGVRPGLRYAAAVSRCPDLHAEVAAGPRLATAWRELLDLLYSRFSDRIEGPLPGTVFLTCTLRQAQELAASLNAPVGLAASQEVAQLAALRAQPGQVREITPDVEHALLPITPLAHLHVLGLTDEQLQQLAFLGLACLGDLLKWSAAQRSAFLGSALGRRLSSFLKGERRTTIQRWTPGEVIKETLTFDLPLHEPGQLQAALQDLMPAVYRHLRGRTAAYLTVHADTPGGRLTASRKPKWPLDERGLCRVAGLAVGDADALVLGIDRLTVQLSGFVQPSRQVGLWAGLQELDVIREVLDRYPAAFVRVQWGNPHALTADQQYHWVDWLTGEAQLRPLTPTPNVQGEPTALPVSGRYSEAGD